METTIAWLLTAVFMIFQWFQPYFTQMYNTKQILAQNLVNTVANQAMITGYITPAQETGLINAYSADTGTFPSDVIINATTTPQARGGSVTVTLEAPEGAFYVLGVFGNPHPPIVASATVTSEAS